MSRSDFLPGAQVDHWEWQLLGACRACDTEMFFHPEDERGAARARRERAAKAVCADCPVLYVCRAHALRSREPHGVWGGMSEHERARVLNETSRAEAV